MSDTVPPRRKGEHPTIIWPIPSPRPSERDPGRESAEGTLDVKGEYGLGENMVEVLVSAGSSLVGKTLAQSRLGFATGLNVFAVIRGDHTITTPAGGGAAEEAVG